MSAWVISRAGSCSLKQEYGYSGGNHTFLDGASGITDYRPDTGLRLVRYHPRTEVTVKWPAVEKRIRQLIQEGSYLTPEELEKYQSDHLEQLPADGISGGIKLSCKSAPT